MLHDYIVIIWFSLFYFYPITLAITGLIVFLVWPKRKRIVIKILLLTLTIFILLLIYNAIERHILWVTWRNQDASNAGFNRFQQGLLAVAARC